MSKRGDCYDNASMESWNHSFKVEAIHGEKFLTRAAAKRHVFDYIDVYYNRKRLHSRLDYQSPVYFETQNVAQLSVRFFGATSISQVIETTQSSPMLLSIVTQLEYHC